VPSIEDVLSLAATHTARVLRPPGISRPSDTATEPDAPGVRSSWRVPAAVWFPGTSLKSLNAADVEPPTPRPTAAIAAIAPDTSLRST